MVKKKAVREKIGQTGIPVKADIESVENETLRRVGNTLAALEEFLRRWDASKAKPDDLFPQIIKIRQFHDALQRWQRNAQKSPDDESRLRRLREFVLICQAYS